MNCMQFNETDQQVKLEFKDVSYFSSGEGGTTDHSKLINRDAADQHPMSAITGLEGALAGKQEAGNYLTKEMDPTVPEWAKQPQKPVYTAQEVGAMPDTTKIPSALSELSEDTTHRVVTDAEKAAWNAKSNFTGSYNDLTDKPTIPDVPVQSVNGKTGAVVLSAEDVGALPESTVIPEAYTLPIASSTQLGGVQPAAKTDTMTQAVGVDAGGALWTAPGSGEGGGTTPELVYSHTCDGTYVSVLDDFQLEADKIYITFMELPNGTGTATYWCRIGSDATFSGAACGFANKQHSVGVKRSSVTQLFKDRRIRLLSGIFPDVPGNYYSAFFQYNPDIVVNKIYIYSTESGTNLPDGLKVEVYKLN